MQPRPTAIPRMAISGISEAKKENKRSQNIIYRSTITGFEMKHVFYLKKILYKCITFFTFDGQLPETLYLYTASLEEEYWRKN